MQSKTDKELLDSFVATGDGVAFAELVSRYSPMVYRACLRLLGNDHDAEDAVQAAFVVLARKAGNLRQEGRLNGWLHRVARLVSMEALRRRSNRERQHEQSAMWQENLSQDLTEVEREAVLSHVDAEMDGLSAVLREAIVLRYLRGFSEQEAAATAGCPLGTMKRRASEGLAKLRTRLAKRGVALGGVALASLLTSEASATIPETLLPSILAAVKSAAATGAAATAATTTATMLAEGAVKAMFIAKVKMVAAIAAAVVVTGTAVPVGIAVAQAVGKDEGPKTNTASVVDDATAMYLRAAAQMRAKDDKAAIETFETLLQTYPDAKTIRPEALYWLADCYARTKDHAASKRVWEKLNSEFPESIWGKYGRGRLNPDHGFITLSPRPDYEVSLTVDDFKMLDQFEARALGQADKHFAKKEPNEYELAAAAYDSFVLKYPKSKAVPYALVRKGRSLQFVGKRSEAIKIYGGVLDYYPDSISNAAPALLYVTQCHYLDGNVKEATKAIAELRADKDYGKHEAAACATFLLARIQAEGGQTDEAISTLAAIAVPFPAYAALAQLRKAEVYEKAGRTAEAVAAYQATLKKYPGTPESDLAHSALEKMGRRAPAGAHAEP